MLQWLALLPLGIWLMCSQTDWAQHQLRCPTSLGANKAWVSRGARGRVPQCAAHCKFAKQCWTYSSSAFFSSGKIRWAATYVVSHLKNHRSKFCNLFGTVAENRSHALLLQNLTTLELMTVFFCQAGPLAFFLSFFFLSLRSFFCSLVSFFSCLFHINPHSLPSSVFFLSWVFHFSLSHP